MSRSPNLPIPVDLFDDPAADLFYPDSYMDRLVRRLNEILREENPLLLERSGPVLTGMLKPTTAVVQVKIDGVTYYLSASTVAP